MSLAVYILPIFDDEVAKPPLLAARKHHAYEQLQNYDSAVFDDGAQPDDGVWIDPRPPMSNRVGGNQSRGSGDTEPCEGCERATDQLGIEVFDDEDQLRPAFAVGPGLKMGWRMHEVLHRMDGNRSRLPAQRQQSFDPQDLGAVPVEQHCQPDAE